MNPIARSFAILLGLAVAWISASSAGDAPSKKEGWVPLFADDNLAGWKIFLDPKNDVAEPEKLFTLKNGVLTCAGSVNGYIRTEKTYGNYVLKLQWRWGDTVRTYRRGSVFVHASGPDKLYPRSVGAQLALEHAGDLFLIGDFKLRVPLAQQDPRNERRFLRLKDNVEKPVGEWNDCEIACKGASVKIVMNGELVNEGSKAETARGGIVLQCDGAELQLREVKLKQIVK